MAVHARQACSCEMVPGSSQSYLVRYQASQAINYMDHYFRGHPTHSSFTNMWIFIGEKFYIYWFALQKFPAYPARRSAAAWWARAPWCPPEASSWSWSPHWGEAAAAWTPCLQTAAAHGCTHRTDRPVADKLKSLRSRALSWILSCQLLSEETLVPWAEVIVSVTL